MELKAVLRTRKESDRPRHNKRVMIGIERMQEHGLIAGDIVRLQLADAKDDAPIAFGTAWPSFLGEDDEVQLSNVAMLNCQAQVGARLLVEKIAVVPAQATTVKVQFATPLSSDEFTRIYAKEVLVDVGCVTPNQLVDIMINGLNRRIRIISIKAEPGTMLTAGTPAMISRENTKVVVVKESDISDKEKQPVTYDSIGGLDKEVADVRQLVETSLQKPEIFAEYGLQPPRGVLLFGPPGTGKTLIARAVAGETQAYVHVINGAEIMNKYYGETEARLREIFEEARKQSPSIIFIDEIDALCPKRGDSESEASKRVVATLLTLMDGVSDRVNDRLVVIGATNRPNAIDSALRRPGRFDREIEVPIPNPEARLHILRKKLGNTPNSLTEEQIVALAASTHGFVGADIEALVREAAIIAIKRHTASELAADTESLAVTNDDVAAASRLIKPSTMREVTLEIPNVKWSDIGGQEETKQLLKESVEWPLKHPEAFQRMGIRPPKGVLLYGPPGCSKTLTAKALATEAGLNFIAVRGPELFSKWVGESEKAVREVFRKARAAAPSIVFFDEIDALTVKRGSSGDGTSVADRVLSQLLTELDGIEPLVNVTVVAATNRPDVIDAGILRPDRIDRLIYVGPPDQATRAEILKLQFKKIACADNVDAAVLAARTDGFSGAEMVSLCQEAAMEAMTENVDAECVEMKHFERCLQGFKKRITPEMLRFYDDFQKKR